MDRIWIDDVALATVVPWAHDMIRRGEFDRLGEYRFASTNEAPELVLDELWRRAGVTDAGRILLWRPVPAVPASAPKGEPSATVPLVIYIDGKRHVIGEAVVKSNFLSDRS